MKDNKAERHKNKPFPFQTPTSSVSRLHFWSLAFTFPPLLFQPLICLTGPDELKTVWLNEDNRVFRTMLSAAGPSVGRCVSHAHSGGRRSQFRGEKQEAINAMIKATLCGTQRFIDFEFWLPAPRGNTDRVSQKRPQVSLNGKTYFEKILQFFVNAASERLCEFHSERDKHF